MGKEGTFAIARKTTDLYSVLVACYALSVLRSVNVPAQSALRRERERHGT